MLRSLRAPDRFAVAAVFVALALLGMRSLTSLDLGFNLEYGREFLESGRLVDHAGFLYTLPSPETPPELRPEPGPGAGYDAEGRYRFVNANWLSQVAMAAVHAVAGFPGLVVLGAALALVVHALVFAATRRFGVPVPVALAGLGLFALAAYERFNLRPEVFGFAVLAAQVRLLAACVEDRGRPSRNDLAALFVLQVLAANLHGYFLLGIALAGTLLAERLVRRAGAARAGWLVALLAAASFVNPWTWRGAVLPIETLVYLWRHDIGGDHGDHPWSHIVELHGPFAGSFPDGIADVAFAGLLLLGVLGALAALREGRIAILLMAAGTIPVALSMARNIAPAGIVLVPAALAALLGARATRTSPVPERRSLAPAIVVGLASVALALGVVTDRFYALEGVPMRFGGGLGRLTLPIGAARWLDEHLPGGRVWCDINSSSTVRFFTDPPRELPINTNQWAYPPAVMATNQALRAGRLPFAAEAERYGIDAVVLRVATSVPLFRALTDDPAWVPVHVEGEHAVFARADGPAGDRDLRRLRGDLQAYVARQRALDRFASRALLPPGRILLEGGALDAAIAVIDAAAVELPRNARVWGMLGSALASRADRRRREADPGFAEDAERARDCFERALELDPGYEFARRGRERIEAWLRERVPG